MVRIIMMSQNRSGEDENYFSDPFKLVHTTEDRTFITDERFKDAEIIDLGDILSPEEDEEYDPPQKIQTPMPTVETPPDSCRNEFINPSVTLVDCCKRPLSGTKELGNELKIVKHQEQINEDSAMDSDIEIIDQTDTNESKNRVKASKTNSKCFNKEKEIQNAIAQRNTFKIDTKKNTGLIGLKIKRPDVDFNKSHETNSIEDTSKEKKTKHSKEKVSKKSKNIHKLKTNTNLKKKDEKVKRKSKLKEYTTDKIIKNKDPFVRKHSKENVTKSVHNFHKEKQTDSDVSKSPISKCTLSPKGCKDVEKSLVKNICENDTKTKDRLSKNNNVSVEIVPTEEKEQREKENKINDDIEQSTLMTIAAEQLNPITNSVVKKRSFPKLNKFTKNVLKKIQTVNKMSPKPNHVNFNQKDIESNINLYIKKNDTLLRKETSKKCEDQQSDNAKNNDTDADPVTKLPCSLKQSTNIKLKSPLKGNQNFTANNCEVQPVNYSPSPLAQRCELRVTEASVVKLPFQFSSISSNISLVDPKTNAQLQHNILNINNIKEKQHDKMSDNRLGSIKESIVQKQPIPETIHSISLGNAKPPPRTNRNIVQKVHYVYPSFPDARMLKKSPKPPHHMNIYRPPPPNACSAYQSCYPMTMPSATDNSGIYTIHNQNYGCRIGSYMLPYGTEIFAYPPPQPPPPPPPPLLPPPPPPLQTLPPASQQQLQQTLPYTNQLTTQNSIIGRNSDGVIKKINVPLSPATEPDIPNSDILVYERIVKAKNFADITQHKPKNVNEVTITPTAIKSEMLKELDTVMQSGSITVFTHSPKNNLKRASTSKLPIRDENKINKPCPLTKKVKVSDPRTLPNKGRINKEPVTKGYSPPILPIPTFENILSQTSIYETVVEKPKKISLDDYKKKRSVLSGKIKDNKYRRLDKLVKNLCQKS